MSQTATLLGRRNRGSKVGHGLLRLDLSEDELLQHLRLDAEEMAALTALADEGLVPPLRLVTPVSGPDVQAG